MVRRTRPLHSLTSTLYDVTHRICQPVWSELNEWMSLQGVAALESIIEVAVTGEILARRLNAWQRL